MAHSDIEFIKEENQKTIERMKQQEGDAEVCKAHFGFREGFERVFFLFEHLLASNGNSNGKVMQIGPVKFSGFEAKDIGRMLVGLGVLYLILDRHGVFTDLMVKL